MCAGPASPPRDGEVYLMCTAQERDPCHTHLVRHAGTEEGADLMREENVILIVFVSSTTRSSSDTRSPTSYTGSLGRG